MKGKRLGLLLILVIVSGVVRAQFTGAKMQLAGINCALCAKTTERALRSLSFISDVKPDLNHNIYVLTFKPGQAVDFEQIGKLVRDENFFITFFKPTIDFSQVKPADDRFTTGVNTYQLLNPAGKTLNGQLEFTMVDKGFAPHSVSKKYPGAMDDNSTKTARVYHLVI